VSYARALVLPVDSLVPAPPPIVRAASVVIGVADPAVFRSHPGGILLLADDRGARIRIRQAGAPYPIVMIDQEGGIVRRVRSLGPAPPPALGRLPVSDTRRQFREAGDGLRSRGVTVDLAPVMDIARGGATRRRSFGPSPAAVAAHGAAAVDGLNAAGVSGCAKHFPGLGTVPVNTDDGVAVDRRPRWKILRELDAYRAVIRAGVRCVMVSSVVVPSLCDRPALLCPATYARLRQMGFRGAIITDSLNGRGLRPWGSPQRVALEALRAGADGVLLTGPGATMATIGAVDRALERGILSPSRLAESAERLQRLRS
jgi:beta-N-acetylhexosaminidase